VTRKSINVDVTVYIVDVRHAAESQECANATMRI